MTIFESGASLFLLTLLTTIAVVWLLFPFLILSRLSRIHKELVKLSQREHLDPARAIEAISSIAINVSGTERNTRKLADFFEGRRVELNQQTKDGA